jgi:hypothetical protein
MGDPATYHKNTHRKEKIGEKRIRLNMLHCHTCQQANSNCTMEHEYERIQNRMRGNTNIEIEELKYERSEKRE